MVLKQKKVLLLLSFSYLVAWTSSTRYQLEVVPSIFSKKKHLILTKKKGYELNFTHSWMDGSCELRHVKITHSENGLFFAPNMFFWKVLLFRKFFRQKKKKFGRKTLSIFWTKETFILIAHLPIEDQKKKRKGLFSPSFFSGWNQNSPLLFFFWLLPCESIKMNVSFVQKVNKKEFFAQNDTLSEKGLASHPHTFNPLGGGGGVETVSRHCRKKTKALYQCYWQYNS